MFETLFSKILKMDVQYLSSHPCIFKISYFIYFFVLYNFNSYDLSNTVILILFFNNIWIFNFSRILQGNI